MKSNQKLSLLITLASLAVVSAGQAQTVVYDNLGTGATAGYGEANANHPIFGDALNLSQGGQLSTVGLSVKRSRRAASLVHAVVAGTFHSPPPERSSSEALFRGLPSVGLISTVGSIGVTLSND